MVQHRKRIKILIFSILIIFFFIFLSITFFKGNPKANQEAVPVAVELLPPPKAKIQLSASADAWDNFVFATELVHKKILNNPKLLSEVTPESEDDEDIQELIFAIDQMLTALPPQYESQRPQFDNFKKALIMKNNTLALQYAEYFLKQEKIAVESETE
jgi:hypothetical protein